MSNERPTKEIKTDGGTVAVLKTYITGFENQELTQIYLSDKPKGEIVKEVDKKGTELVLVSLDGKTENLYQELMNLPLTDVIVIKQELETVLNPKVQSRS